MRRRGGLNKRALRHRMSQVEIGFVQVCICSTEGGWEGREWGKNNTTMFFLWRGFGFLEMTPHKSEHDLSAVNAEIPSAYNAQGEIRGTLLTKL